MRTSFLRTTGLGDAMPLLAPDRPYGKPAFALLTDQIATVMDLVCRGAHAARGHVTPGMLEVPMTRIVRKAMKRVKKTLGLTNLQIVGEHELDDMETNDVTILGRIDIVLQFLHQFGDEGAYVGVECKRLLSGDATLNGRYVSEGVDRFATGKYAAGHRWGFMLGYVLTLPAEEVVRFIDRRMRRVYGEAASLQREPTHPRSVAVFAGSLLQGGHHYLYPGEACFR